MAPEAMIDSFFADVEVELRRGRAANGGGLNSLHEAYAVMLEEVDEFWEQVKTKPANRNYGAIYRELVQIAAVALSAACEISKDD
jgi:hypothetical protein